ncbi:hypothetical protein [Chroococcidiopsis sp.]|uniref:hypothetical protein n=1 Tax=Chroococcidiopsis sp. TaxID=3088168 RepID=UPI003F380A44
MDFKKEFESLILDALKKTVPQLAQKTVPPVSGAKRTTELVDRGTSAMGFSKITKTGYTP